MHLRCEALDTPVWRVWLGPDAAGHVAVGGPGLGELEVVLQRAGADPACRVVVLASDGVEFCRGMDLQALADRQGAPATGVAAYARVLGLLRGLRAASVCVVTGAASGGGVGLAAACDLVIAGPTATFVLPELYFGLIPAVVLPVLGERVGLARARWLALTAEALTADAALRLGLVDERADDPARALNLRLKYLLRCSPVAVARLKRFSAEIAGLPLDAALTAGAARTAADATGPEVGAAVAGFLAGEPPPWAVRVPSGGSSR